MSERWKRGSLADQISKLIWGVDDYNKEAVRHMADKVQELEDELLEEKRLAGCGSEREAALIARAEAAERELMKVRAERDEACIELVRERGDVVAYLLAPGTSCSNDVIAEAIERGDHRENGS